MVDQDTLENREKLLFSGQNSNRKDTKVDIKPSCFRLDSQMNSITRGKGYIVKKYIENIM